MIIAILCFFAALGQTRTAEDDPHWPEQIVKRAFDEVSVGLRTSWSERYLARLGDSASPEIMKCISTKPFTNENAKTALTLVQMSFADPQVIRHERNRNPIDTLILLDYINKHTSDADLKSRIESIRKQLRAWPSVAEENEKKTGVTCLGSPKVPITEHSPAHCGSHKPPTLLSCGSPARP